MLQIDDKAPRIKTIEELKSYLIYLIREDVKAFDKLEGSGLLPTSINRTSQILIELGVPTYQCKFCDVSFPLDFLWQVMGRRLCSRCRKNINVNNNSPKESVE